MASYIKTDAIGNLGQDPELRYTQSGKAVCNFSIAINTGYGEKKETLWLRVSCWDKTAENASKYLRKGSSVFVSGPIKENSYRDRNGDDKKSVELTAFSVVFLDSKDRDGDTRGDDRDRGGRNKYDDRKDQREGASGRRDNAPGRAPQRGGPPPEEDSDIPY